MRLEGAGEIIDDLDYAVDGRKFGDLKYINANPLDSEFYHSYDTTLEETTTSNAAETFAKNVGEQAYQGSSNSVDDIIRDGSHLENGKLKPNVKYQTGEHEYIYETNSNGLISHASTENLQPKKHTGRLNHNSNTYGKEVGDHAGHIFGDRFGGSPELDNLVSQAKQVNLSEFKIIENEWARALEDGKTVTVDIEIYYNGSSSRPTSFDVSYTINDIPFFKHIEN